VACRAVLCCAVPCCAVCQGLDYLHSKRLVHFDLKSDNLLVTIRDKVPCVKIADMGLAKARSNTFATGMYTR
jgi:serine/threonine protein kinase